MGRVKPTYIKRSGDRIMEDYPELVSTDFKENKKLVAEVFNVSKNYQNRLAGYLTTAKKREEA